jgi:DNA uptake protein ComE-like DNA-binding protein
MKRIATASVVFAVSLLAAPLAFAQGATTAPAKAPPAKAAAPAPSAAPQGQFVNLNTAPAAELDKLPQIGEARAKAIVAKRPYKNWDDFVAKKVVPSNAEAAIKGKVRF